MGDVIKLLKQLRLTEDGRWSLQPSEIGGYGIFAVRNIKRGDAIFIDSPIVTGPRSVQQLAACVVCYRQDRPLEPCKNDCHLPLCVECQAAIKGGAGHAVECAMLKKMEPKGDSWSWALLRSLTSIRCLFMTELEKSVVRQMHANKGDDVNTQIRNVTKSVKNPFTPEEIAWMTHFTGVIDGTGFEIEKTSTTSVRFASLKGLYPLAGRVNHSCRPNARRHFTDSDGTMLFVACRDIFAGQEVTVSYCPLLWPAYVRQSFLFKTKRFKCNCVRCRKPTVKYYEKEFDDFLAGIYCRCCTNGLVVPTESENWRCRTCSAVTSSKNMVHLLMKLLDNKHNLPASNYVQVHEKLHNIWSTKKENFPALSNDDLERHRGLIEEILQLINDLQLGDTRKKGLLLVELHYVLKEMADRKMLDCELADEAKKKAKLILKDDISVSI